MPMIPVPSAELAKTLRIWLIIIGQRRPEILRGLWTRRGEEHDGRKIDFARNELVRTLVEDFERSKWQVMRSETLHDRLNDHNVEG